MRTTSLALAIVLVALALLMSLDIQAVAGDGTEPDTECVLWADIKPWAITRCESDWGEVCFVSTSGFLVCRFD